KGKSRKEKKLINKEINRIKTVLNRRKAFTNAMREARSAVAGLSGEQKRAVNATLDAYGSEHEANGVVVAVGEPTQTGQGMAGIENGEVIIAFRPDELTSNSLFATIAHEGSHIIDAKLEIQYNSPPFGGSLPISGSDIRSRVTSRQTEYDAYSITFLAAKGNNFSGSIGINGVVFYQRGWSEIDERRLNDALGQIGRGPNDQAGTNPANWNVRGRWK